jgi:hypothetical protein
MDRLTKGSFHIGDYVLDDGRRQQSAVGHCIHIDGGVVGQRNNAQRSIFELVLDVLLEADADGLAVSDQYFAAFEAVGGQVHFQRSPYAFGDHFIRDHLFRGVGFKSRQQRILADILPADEGFFEDGVGRGGKEDQLDPIRNPGAADLVLAVTEVRYDGHVQLQVYYILYQVHMGAETDVYLDGGMQFFGQGPDSTGDRGNEQRADPDADIGMLHMVDIALGGDGLSVNFLGIVVKALAGHRENNPFALDLYELHAQAGLEVFNMLGHRRLREAQLFGRRGDVLFRGDIIEDDEVVGIDIGKFQHFNSRHKILLPSPKSGRGT